MFWSSPKPIIEVVPITTPIIEVKPGHLGYLTSDQERCLQNVKSHLIVKQLDRDEYDDWYLLRFCRARNFNSDKTIEMFTKWILAKKEYQVDTILEIDYKISDERMPKVFTEFFSGIDKKGRPVKCEKYHQMDKNNIFEVPLREWIQYNIKCSEELIHQVFPYCSKIAEKRIDEVVIIIDFKGNLCYFQNNI